MSISLRAQTVAQQFGAYHETKIEDGGVSRQTGRVIVTVGTQSAILPAGEARRFGQYLLGQPVDAPEPIIGSMVPGV